MPRGKYRKYHFTRSVVAPCDVCRCSLDDHTANSLVGVANKVCCSNECAKKVKL